jgi:hypothetical protein
MSACQALWESCLPSLQRHASSHFPAQTLCTRGWKASFEELHDVDHFEIIWNLTQEDDVLNQVEPWPFPLVAAIHSGQHGPFRPIEFEEGWAGVHGETSPSKRLGALGRG